MILHIKPYFLFSIVANKEFQKYMRRYVPSIRFPSPNTVVHTTKKIAGIIHQFVEELKGNVVCIILDGVTKNKTVFYNVLLSTDSTNQ